MRPAAERARCGRPAGIAALVLAAALLAGPPAGAAGGTPPGVRILPTGGLSMEVAALLLSGQEGGTLPLAVLATPLAPASAGPNVAVVVEVAGAPLLAAATEGRLWLELALYAVSAEGEVRGSLLESLEVDLPTWRERLAGGGLKLVRSLPLPPGEHSLRVLVRAPATREVGLRVVPLAVADPAKGEPALQAPLFAESGEPWLASSRLASSPPWGDILPAARPLLGLGGSTTLRLLVPAALAASPLAVELRSAGDATTRAAARIAATDRTLAPGLVSLTLQFEPSGAPGPAALRVLTAGGEAASLEVPVILVEEGAVAASWAAAIAVPPAPPERGAAARGREAAGAAAPPAPRPRHRLAAYRRALAPLATAEGGRAGSGLRDFDAAVLQGGASSEELAETALEVLGPLAAAEADALLPVLWHYLELYRQEVGTGSPLLSSHAREMAFRLADLYAAAAPGPGGGRLAATALVAHVATLPPGASRQFLARALQRALAHNPADPVALLCSAIDAARHGEHGNSVAALEALRRLEPRDGETRLRLALSRERLGERRRARSLLAELIESPAAAGDPAPWWLPLAYQELARILDDERDRAAAERTLRRGLARLPGEEKLSLQLALLLAERGDRAQAGAVLAEVRPSARDRGYDSARHRYTLLPAEPLQRAMAELRARAEAARTRLAAALGTGGGDGQAP